MNAFNWRDSPRQTPHTAAEQAYARKGLARTSKVGHMSTPVGDVFSQPIVGKAATDRTNAIRNSCYFYDCGDADRAKAGASD